MRSRHAASPSSPVMTAASRARATGRIRGTYCSHSSSRVSRPSTGGSSRDAAKRRAEAARSVVVARHRHEQPRPAVEVVVDELARDAAGGRDVGDGHRVDAALADQAPRGLEDVCARVAAGLSSLHLTRVKLTCIVHVSNGRREGGSNGVDERVRADRSGRRARSTSRSWRSPVRWVIASRSSTVRPARRDHLRGAGRAHRARGGGARGARARRRRCARHLGAQLARVGHRRARGDGGGRDGHRRSARSAPSASWPRS